MFGKAKQQNKNKSPKDISGQDFSNKIPDETQVDVYTLPEKFLPSAKPTKSIKKRSKITIILIGFLLLVLAGGLLAWFYFRNNDTNITPSPTTNIAPLNEEIQPPEENIPETNQSPEPVVYAAKDLQGNVLGMMEIELAPVDYDLVDQIEITSTKTSSDPKIVGVVYRVTPSGYSLEDKAVVSISYFDENLSSSIENSLRIGYEEASGQWRVIEESKVDLIKNKVSLEIRQLPRARIALVSNLTVVPVENNDPDEQTESENYENKELRASLDTDSDLLTDVEELLYGTSFDLPDTDSDGYIDGQELLNFYSPLMMGQNLSDSGLFSSYVNDEYGYEVMYPQTWTLSNINDDNSIIIFNSPTSQFFEVVIESKTAEVNTIEEWYQAQLPGINISDLRRETVGPDKLDAIYSLDGSSVYFLYGDWVVALTYGLGIEKEADYLTTWQLMIKSWKTTNPTSAQADNQTSATE